MEVVQLGLSHVKLNKFQEEYVVQRPSSVAHNLIFGNLYIEHQGILTVEKVMEGGHQIRDQRMKLELEFKKQGWSKKNWAVVEGRIPVRPGANKYWVI